MKARFVSGAALLFSLASGVQAPPLDLSGYKPYAPGVGAGDYILRPPYANAPELTARPDVPKGTVIHFTMDSKDSLIYPGIAKDKPLQFVPYTRGVTVYVPANVPKNAPFLVSQDSMGRGILPTILDNMIADHRVPAMVAIMIDSGGSDSLGSERGLEYDTLSDRYDQFIETEVIPRVEREAHVTLTKDPNARMSMGGSSGANCAFTMAWYRPDLYRRVISYSGTYVNQQWPYDPKTPHGGWEYHDHLIAQAKKKPLRLWLHVGEHDLRENDPESTYHNWPLANVRMAQVLKAKGYPYQFVYAYDSNHVDGRVVNQTLPQALEWVWKDYKK